MGLSSCCSAPASPSSIFYCCQGEQDGVPELAAEAERHFQFLQKLPHERKIVNPSIPYVGTLPITLHPGILIEMKGSIEDKARRVAFNLTCGIDERADVALHVNPRFDSNYVVRNCRIGGAWGQEENAAVTTNPFKRKKNFTLQVLCTTDEFMIAVNGSHFCSFTYRIPLSKVQCINITGDVAVWSIEFKKVDAYPNDTNALVKKLEVGVPIKTDENSYLPMPFAAELQCFPVGYNLEIQAKVKLLPYSFYINLQSDLNIWPHPIIPLHINPRFKTSKNVVRNAWVKGKWGSEEVAPLWLFKPGKLFTLTIECYETEYILIVDGALIGRFKHRCSMDIVAALYIQGDLNLKSVALRFREQMEEEEEIQSTSLTGNSNPVSPEQGAQRNRTDHLTSELDKNENKTHHSIKKHKTNKNNANADAEHFAKEKSQDKEKKIIANKDIERFINQESQNLEQRNNEMGDVPKAEPLRLENCVFYVQNEFYDKEIKDNSKD